MEGALVYCPETLCLYFAAYCTLSSVKKGESYIVLFHISQFDCFLFARDIRDLPMTPETCQVYHTVVWYVSAKYTVCEL